MRLHSGLSSVEFEPGIFSLRGPGHCYFLPANDLEFPPVLLSNLAFQEFSRREVPGVAILGVSLYKVNFWK